MANTDDYKLDVVKAGDLASGNFKVKCDEANGNLEHETRKLLKTNGRTWSVETGSGTGVKKVIEGIDGVGTKVQIYTNVFNDLIRQKEEELITNQELFDTSVELWERMLHDLIAMNVDDFRDGEMAVAITNIIDINHLKGIRGKVFSDSMAQAMYNVITELQIAITAGETAILGEPKKVKQLEKESILFHEELKLLIRNGKNDITEKLKLQIFDLISIHEKAREIILEDVEFNIGGTGLGLVGNKEKLVELKPGQAIIYLQEKPTENGIIGPRSNGITSIRKYLTELAGDNWENITFEEFLESIGDEKASKLPDTIKQDCRGIKMWDIATGKTTVFNPFISRVLLGGLNGDPIAKISSQIHVTGNPGRKISEGLRGRDNLVIDIDLNEIKIPQIIEILQTLCKISDENAMSSWNMGIPYVIVCDEKDIEKVITSANNEGFTADNIGTVLEKNDENNKNIVRGVGVGKTDIEL